VSKGRTVEIVVGSGVAPLTMPELIGATQRMAELKLGDMGLEFRVLEEFNEEIPKGEVIDQYPLPQAEVRPGSTVEIVVSMGPEHEPITMPNLIGMPLEDAYAALEEFRITVSSVSSAASLQYPENFVIEQSIPAETATESGIEITLTVSEGPGPAAAVETTFSYFVPILSSSPSSERSVQATLTDSTGMHIVFNQMVPGGSTITIPMSISGPGILNITVDGTQAHTEVYE